LVRDSGALIQMINPLAKEVLNALGIGNQSYQAVRRKLTDTGNASPELVSRARELRVLDAIVQLNGGAPTNLNQDIYSCRYWSTDAIEERLVTNSDECLRVEFLIPIPTILHRLTAQPLGTSDTIRDFLNSWAIDCVVTEAEAGILASSYRTEMPKEWGRVELPWDGRDKWARFRASFTTRGIVIHRVTWTNGGPPARDFTDRALPIGRLQGLRSAMGEGRYQGLATETADWQEICGSIGGEFLNAIDSVAAGRAVVWCRLREELCRT